MSTDNNIDSNPEEIQLFGADDGIEHVATPGRYQQADNGLIPKDVEWDWFSEIDDDAWVLEPSAPVGADNNPLIAVDVEWDWFQEFDDESWLLEPSAPVGPNLLLAPALTDPWDFAADEIDALIVGSSYQQADFQPALAPDPWDFSTDDVDPVSFVSSFQQSDQIISPQVFNEDFDNLDAVDVEDFFADDFGNDDVPAPIHDQWDFSHDDAAYEPLIVSAGYFQLDAAQTPAAFDEAWDWGQDDADEPWQYIVDDDDDAIQIDNNPVIAPSDGWNWDDQDDAAEDPWQLIVDDDDDAIQVGPNAALNLEDAFDQSFDDSDAADDTPVIVASADFALIDLSVQPLQFYEDSADHWSQDSDDDTFVALDTDPVGASVVIAPSQLFDDPWDFEQGDDDYAVSDDWLGADSQLGAPFDDAWEWSDDADEHLHLDIQTHGSSADDFRDPEFDWSQDDDEQLIADDVLGPDLPIGQAIADAWEWIADDLDHDFDWALEPNALVASIPILPSQFTDDAWDWTEWLEVEDQVDEDHGYIASLPYGIGSSYWRIYCPARLFTIACPARNFRILSNMPLARFLAKDPAEAIRLLYDFTAQLAMLPIANVLLSNIVSVTIGNVFGGDASLAQNGAALLLSSLTQLEVPVLGGLNENDYSIRVVVQTTDSLTTLELTGILPVRS